MKTKRALLTTLTLTLTLAAAACGGTDPAAVSASSEAVVAAESAQAAAQAAAVAAPLADRDRGAADVMGAVRDLYGRKMTCAEVALAAGILSVDLGAGCAVNGHTVSGAFTVAHTRTGTSSAFTLTLADLAADGTSVDGTVHASGGARVVTVDATLMVTDGAVITEHLFAGAATPDAAGVGLEGAARRDDGATARDLTFTALYVAYGDCYPSAGEIAVDATGQPTTLVTFSAATPTTGEVSVKVGRLPPQTVTLPACP